MIIRRFLIWQAVLIVLLLGLLGLTDWLESPQHWLSRIADPVWFGWGLQALIVAALAGVGAWLFHRMHTQLRILEGLLHMCAGCRQIKVSGRWQPIETYLIEHSHVQVSHGFCPTCLERLYPEIVESIRKDNPLYGREERPAA